MEAGDKAIEMEEGDEAIEMVEGKIKMSELMIINQISKAEAEAEINNLINLR